MLISVRAEAEKEQWAPRGIKDGKCDRKMRNESGEEKAVSWIGRPTIGEWWFVNSYD